MSQIGNRLAGNSGSVQPNSLYSNSPLQQRIKSPNNANNTNHTNFNPNQNALRQLYQNQPRDNSVSFKNPYSTPNMSRKQNGGQGHGMQPGQAMPAGQGMSGMMPSQTMNAGQFKMAQNGQKGSLGGPSQSMSSGNIPAYLQNKQPNAQPNMWELNASNSNGVRSPMRSASDMNNMQNMPNNSAVSSHQFHHPDQNNDLYSNGAGIYYAPNANFSETVANVAEKAMTDTKKQFRIVKQYCNEKFGHGQKTIDQEVHEKLTRLKTDKVIYQKLLKLSNQYLEDHRKFMKSQSNFGEFLKEVGLKTPEATDSLTSSGNVQCRIAHAQQPVNLSLQRFTNAIETLVDKTMMDSVSSSNRLNQTRLEFDAIRTELEDLQRKSIGPPNDVRLIHKYNSTREQYAKNREELLVKLQLLDENRIRVLKNSLETFDISQSRYLGECNDIVQQAEYQLNQKRIQNSFNGYDQTPGLPGDNPNDYLEDGEVSVESGGGHSQGGHSQNLIGGFSEQNRSRTSFGSESQNQAQIQNLQSQVPTQPQQSPQNMQNLVDNLVFATQAQNSISKPTTPVLEDQTIPEANQPNPQPTVSILPLANRIENISISNGEGDGQVGQVGQVEAVSSQLSPGESAI